MPATAMAMAVEVAVAVAVVNYFTNGCAKNHLAVKVLRVLPRTSPE